MAHATPAQAPKPDSHRLRREVDRVRRRARAVLLGGAVVAALAADVWYEIASFWVLRLFSLRLWYPPFFFVALAVFAVFVARRTRTLALSGLLDARFALKERLVSAFRFARLPAVPSELREAQARETLRAVDFDRLRASFRFRPWGPLAWLAVGSGIVAALMYRYPESFNPRNLAFRQGRVVFMAVKNIATGQRNGGGPGAADGPPGDGDSHPLVALVTEKPSPKKETPAETQTAGTSGEKPPPAGEQSPKPKSPEGTSSHREPPSGEKPPPGEGRGSRPGPNEGGSLGRAASLEETDGISPPTSRPESGLAAAAADLRGPGTGPSLPPLPFVRLLGGNAVSGVLFDPEALNIVLEAYPPKYREHLEAYLKALQTLKEGRKGS